jgi:hypothetical protein
VETGSSDDKRSVPFLSSLIGWLRDMLVSVVELRGGPGISFWRNPSIIRRGSLDYGMEVRKKRRFPRRGGSMGWVLVVRG